MILYNIPRFILEKQYKHAIAPPMNIARILLSIIWYHSSVYESFHCFLLASRKLPFKNHVIRRIQNNRKFKILKSCHHQSAYFYPANFKLKLPPFPQIPPGSADRHSQLISLPITSLPHCVQGLRYASLFNSHRTETVAKES